MEKKINIAELLRDCPKGMELYSTIYGTVYFERVKDTGNAVLIEVKTSCNTDVQFYPDGKFNTHYSDSEMTLFPSKDVRTWERFHRPFKDGDIISDGNYIAIFNKLGTTCHCTSTDIVYYHCYYSLRFCKFKAKLDFGIGTSPEFRYATKEEKEKLFQAIKDNGYRWNSETKTLEKLLRFKVGDRIKSVISLRYYTVVDIKNDLYFIKSDTEKYPYQISFRNEINYELVLTKFDITTLKPFDKVLVRDNNTQKWTTDFFSFIDESQIYPFICSGHYVHQCIPYEGNEHLLGTTNDCDDYYKTWEK